MPDPHASLPDHPVDMVSESREPASINTGASTCVNNRSGRIWPVVQDEFLGARVLESKTIRRANATTHRPANRGGQSPGVILPFYPTSWQGHYAPLARRAPRYPSCMET